VNNRVAAIAIGAVLTGLLVGVVIAGSGGDGDGGSTNVEPPELTVPGGSDFTGSDRSTRRQDEGTTNDSSSTDSGGAATPAPDSSQDSGGAAPAQPQDTQQNDAPPPSGSPAQRFEQFCEDNPGAC
jgi:hypothetical protein